MEHDEMPPITCIQKDIVEVEEPSSGQDGGDHKRIVN
jgi:hypothetical protein